MPLRPVDFAPRQPLSRPAVPVLSGLALMVLLAAGGILGPPAEAQPPCHVPGDYATIQAAIDESTCATINLAAGTYEEDITISRDVTIGGAGEDQTVIDGGDNGRVVTINGNPVVTIKNITIQHGHSTNDGGGILNFGNLTIQNSTLSDNEADGRGGGILNVGNLTIQNSTLSDNEAFEGGGIGNAGSLFLRNSTITDNEAFGDFGGGGIYNLRGSLFLRNSTVTDNTANVGNDITNEGSLTLRNVTFNECVDFSFGTGCP